MPSSLADQPAGANDGGGHGRAQRSHAWLYVDDYGKTQGPFSTAKMRTWIRKGYLSHERQARPISSTEDGMQAIWAWPELNPGAELARSRAQKRWRTARQVVSMAAAHASAVRGNESFNSFDRALQQRYARSSFGFDALLLRCASPRPPHACPRAPPRESV